MHFHLFLVMNFKNSPIRQTEEDQSFAPPLLATPQPLWQLNFHVLLMFNIPCYCNNKTNDVNPGLLNGKSLMGSPIEHVEVVMTSHAAGQEGQRSFCSCTLIGTWEI